MTEPIQILTDKRAQILELEIRLSVERSELRGMEKMAALLGAHPTPTSRTGGDDTARAAVAPRPAATDAAARGRQLGSISMRWRAALWHLDALGGNFAPSDIVSAVRDLEGREMRPADAKRQMEAYSQLGFISAENGTFNVTDQFRSKFADSAPNGSNENAPPETSSGAETAPDAQDGRPQE